MKLTVTVVNAIGDTERGGPANVNRYDVSDCIAGKIVGCETMLTFEKGLEPTGLFSRIGPAARENNGPSI